jgi:hypothetical protein
MVILVPVEVDGVWERKVKASSMMSLFFREWWLVKVHFGLLKLEDLILKEKMIVCNRGFGVNGSFGINGG